MSLLVHNYNGGTTDYYGTDLVLNRLLNGDVLEGLAVAANGTPNMTVNVQPGSGHIRTGTYPSSFGYLISIDTATPGVSVTIGTAAASPRIDYIVAYIDLTISGTTNPTYVNNTNAVLKLADVQGTPAGSPVVPTLSQIQTAIGAANPYIILAQVSVGASATTITNPNITDLRAFIAPLNANSLGGGSYVDNNCTWSLSSGLNGTMTAGKVFINVAGVMIPQTLSLITSHAFTASKDTYAAVDYTGTITYNEVANNTASPTLPANAIWLAIVVTSGSAITSVNTGRTGAVAPVISSQVLNTSDTNGQLIHPAPNQRTLGYAASSTTNQTGITSEVPITGLTITIINPAANNEVKIIVTAQVFSSVTGDVAELRIKEGSTVLKLGRAILSSATSAQATLVYKFSPTAGAHTYTVTINRVTGSGTLLVENSAAVSDITAEIS